MALRAAGSSPLTRGKRSCRAAQPCCRRLIPAHAGKTWWGRSSLACSRAHPRSRGENVAALLRAAWRVGSSPLTRGKLTRTRARQRNPRLIPAHAGKTCIRRPGSIGTGAHPRSRGENTRHWEITGCTCGSSPLTRGKRGASAYAQIMWGLIPAHAGKTCATVSKSSASQAHPRSRGENPDRSR
mgnify:CR=1 FL=1